MALEEKDLAEMLKPLLGDDDFTAFLNSLNEDPVKGAVCRPGSEKDALEEIPGSSAAEAGYIYYPYGTAVGKNPLYLAGGFYPMDHSAFRVSKNLADALKGRKNLRVLDLCAAPGGKSVALSFLDGEIALLVSNDVSAKRASVMKTNFERCGIKNAVVTAKDVSDFLGIDSLRGFFDAIILDAPCSGSGMSRKKEKMGEDWSREKVSECVAVQQRLIRGAAELLAPGGVLSYSTCSYSREEDEDLVAGFLSERPDFKALQTADGIAGYAGLGSRYIPGLYPGEGQYQCLLVKEGEWEEKEFPSESIEIESQRVGGAVYRGIRRVIASSAKDFFALAPLKVGMAVDAPDPKFPWDWDFCHAGLHIFPEIELDAAEALTYLSGQDLRKDVSVQGKTAIATYRGLPLGFLKIIPGRQRNMLPKGLRISL